MPSESSICFPPFCLNIANERLYRGGQPIILRPKTFAVLRCLVEHAGQLLTKDAFFDAVWPDTIVSDVVLKVCIRELRQALGDTPRRPRFIETVHGRGYRFIGPIVAGPESNVRQQAALQSATPMHLAPGLERLSAGHGPTVGRQVEIEILRRCLDKARSGRRQVVFVTGEMGLGKTTVVDAFVAEAKRTNALWSGRGQCIAHYGSGEAYMPVLEALERLCRDQGNQGLVHIMAQQAPTWLMQMPGLLSQASLEQLQRDTRGANRGRMLRELARALEVVTTERLLVLVLEDLHWSDRSTLDVISMLARRHEPARLLLLGTYRPEEVMGREHVLYTMVQELQTHHDCEVLPLTLLPESAVEDYLRARWPGHPYTHQLAQFIYRRTEGNPFFMVNMAAHVAAHDSHLDSLMESELGMPASLRQMLEERFDRLSLEEQRVLEVASIAGPEFAAAGVAAGLDVEVEQVEVWCEGLARREQWLQSSEPHTWPDGTVSAGYTFMHTLYQEIAYGRLTASRRLRLHRVVGQRLEAAYGAQAHDLAAELAMHFEEAQDTQRAIAYRKQAAENAIRRSAHIEAITHLRKGLELLMTFPSTPARHQQELDLQIVLVPSLMAVKGFAAPEVERAHARTHFLCQQVGETPQLLRVLRGLWTFFNVGGQRQKARDVTRQVIHLAQCTDDPECWIEAHRLAGGDLFFCGEIVQSLPELETVVVLCNAERDRSQVQPWVYDSEVVSRPWIVLGLWFLGYPDQALQQEGDLLTLARELDSTFNLAFALTWTAILRLCLRQERVACERIEELIELGTKWDFTQLLAIGKFLQGAILTTSGHAQEGLAQMRQALDAHEATGARLHRVCFFTLLAEACARVGQVEEGLVALTEASTLAAQTEERYYEAERHRLKGELLYSAGCGEPGAESTPAEHFRKAIEVARHQGARSLELRAAMSLARLWQQDKRQEAYDLLAPVYNGFTEGFETADLRDARSLLDGLKS